MTITFDPTKYDGYIFDCDGTLADTMPLHYQAWSETLEGKLGRKSDFTESMFYRFGGMPARQIVERLNKDFGYTFVPEDFAHEKEMNFIKLLPGIGPVQEVIDVLNAFPAGTKVAVASGGLTDIVRDTLKFLNIHVGPGEKIQFLVGSDQVKHGKPHPELFLRAAELLGATPTRCLVFEDAEPGFLAAKAAGMDYIDVRPFRANISAAAHY
jgi:beta-phosphoglucomutase-like phosphatase (HAD superfamily)